MFKLAWKLRDLFIVPLRKAMHCILGTARLMTWGRPLTGVHPCWSSSATFWYNWPFCFLLSDRSQVVVPGDCCSISWIPAEPFYQFRLIDQLWRFLEKRDPIPLVLWELHQFPISFNAQLKMLISTLKASSGLGPRYLNGTHSPSPVCSCLAIESIRRGASPEWKALRRKPP